MLDEKDLKPTDTNPSEENTSSEGTSEEQNQTPSVYTNQNTFGSYSMTQEQKDQYDAFQHLSDQEKLWFFIDDMVPTDTTDTAIIPYQDDSGAITILPKSMDIFEEIANAPNHAAKLYPNMIPYFPEILRLYNTVVEEDNNPYWHCEPVLPNNTQTASILLALNHPNYEGFLSRTPKQGSIPCRLHYGDTSHTHDFVGMVYMYVKRIS